MSPGLFAKAFSKAGGDERCVMEQTLQPQLLGHYIVADPAICHGKPTFRGTRIFDMAAKRMGAVIRVSHIGLAVWRLHAEQETHFA
jgi:hypothetical protein